MKCILGKKIEMSQTWQENGRVVPVTILQIDPCRVTQVKTKEKDGYAAVQFGAGTVKRLTKPMSGHLRGLPPVRWMREFPLENTDSLKRGDVIEVGVFAPGDKVKVTSVSKGKGFQGVVKRHHFHGHPATHGHKDQLRMPGSIGAGGVQHVRKGQRMAGRMGGEQVTVRNLEVVKVDSKKNLLYLKGAVPGGRNALVMISAV